MAVRWSGTPAPFPADRCLHELVEEQAARTPDATAVLFGETSLSYAELDRRANQLAHFLRGRGVRPETLVGVCLDRSLELVVGLLGVLKAGGAYVPVDPELPAERIAMMLTGTGAPVVLTRRSLLDRLPPLPAGGPVCLDDWDPIARAPQHRPPAGVGPQQLAYVIYTSGSTGQPKGVMLPHRGVCNRLWWAQAEYRLSASDTVLQKTPISFDVSVWELFWPLMVGARLVLAEPGGHRSPDYLVEVINRYQVTTVHFVPPMLDEFLAGPPRGCPSLRQVLTSGDTLRASTAHRFHHRYDARLHNLYGPTEASIDVTAWHCPPDADPDEPVPIGRPIGNVSVLVLDAQLGVVPVGVAGEIYVGGVGLARGYLGRPGGTAERFVPDPFGSWGGRLYRTGDVGRWRSDGAVEFLGRVDRQVKVRGHRVELGEVEGVLLGGAGVRGAVVVVRGGRLVAYVVGGGAGWCGGGGLRSWLGGVLPEYMVPSVVVELPALPLTANGKVDRAALPAPQYTGESTRGPRNPIEQLLCELFAEVLDAARVGIDDGFFALGGDSVLSIRLVSRAREAGIGISVRDVFRHPTVAALAEVATRTDPPTAPAAPAGDDAGAFPLAGLSQAEIDRLELEWKGGA